MVSKLDAPRNDQAVSISPKSTLGLFYVTRCTDRTTGFQAFRTGP